MMVFCDKTGKSGMVFYSLVMFLEVGRNFSLVGLFVEMKCESAVVCFIVAVNISIATESDYIA